MINAKSITIKGKPVASIKINNATFWLKLQQLWKVFLPTLYRLFSLGNLILHTPEELLALTDLHRLRVIWELPNNTTQVKIKLSMLNPKYAYEAEEINKIPTGQSISNSDFYALYIAKYQPEGYDGVTWLKPTDATEDCVFTPTSNTVGVSINLCDAVNNGYILGDDIADVLNIVAQIVEISTK